MGETVNVNEALRSLENALQAMPIETLSRLSDDSQPPKDLDELIARHCPTILMYTSNLENRKAEVILQNRNAAELNLTKEPHLNEGRMALEGIYNDIRKEVEQYDSYYAKLMALQSDRTDLNTLCVMLDSSSKSTNERAKEITDQLFQKQIALDEWRQKFFSAKSDAISRGLKAAKVHEMERQAKQQSRAPAAAHPSYAHPFSDFPRVPVGSTSGAPRNTYGPR